MVVSPCHILGVRLALAVILGVGVEALRIAWVADRGNNGPPPPAVEGIFPVDTVEEWMCFYASSTAADVAEAPGAVNSAEGADDILCWV